MQKKYFTTNTKTKLVYCPLNSLIFNNSSRSSKQLTFNRLIAQATGINKIRLYIIIRIKLIMAKKKGTKTNINYLKILKVNE